MGYCIWADMNAANKTYHDNEWGAGRPVDVRLAPTGAERRPSRYDGNHKSKHVQEKCGFRYQWTTQDVDVPLMNEKRTGHVNLMTREDYLSKKEM